MPTAHRIRRAGTADTWRCRPDETLLFSGLAAGLRLPYECSTGSCGTCRVRLVAGVVESRWPEAPGLSGRDRAKGRILCCQSEPRGDVVIEVATEPPGPEPRPGARCARVDEIVPLAPGTIRVVCALEEPLLFLPGQYVLLAIPGVCGRRAYSMCDLPRDGRRLDFVVRAKPGGAATGHLFEKLRPGDTLALEGPFGRAFLRTPLVRDLALAAGGSGLGPVLSILRAALAEPRTHGHRIALVFGVRRREDLFDVALLEELAGQHPGFELAIALSEPEPGEAWKGEVGLVHEVLLRRVPDLPERDVYLAGPPPMIDAVLRTCVFERGMLPERIRFDRFS